MKFIILLLSAALMSCSDGGNSENTADIQGHKNSGKLSEVPTYTNTLNAKQIESFKSFSTDFEAVSEYMEEDNYNNSSYNGCHRTESMNPPNSDNYNYKIEISGSSCAISFVDNGVINSASTQTDKSYSSKFSSSSNSVFKVENSSKLMGNLLATVVSDNSSEGEVNVNILPNGSYNYSSTSLIKTNMRSIDLTGREVLVNGAIYLEANSNNSFTSTLKFSFTDQDFRVTLLITLSGSEGKASTFDKISLNGKEISEKELGELTDLFSDLKNEGTSSKVSPMSQLTF